MERQFTATVYIVENQKVLLIFHRKHGKWLPPGGHVDPNEIPTQAALREVREETGLEVELISQENIWIDRGNAKSIERPYLCLLEEIPPYGDKPAHQHIDMIYLAKPVGGQEKLNQQETDGLRWFTLDEVEQLAPDQEIFVDTILVIRQILLQTIKQEDECPIKPYLLQQPARM